MISSIGGLIFFLLVPISHVGASLFFAKPRFNKIITAAIWFLYVVFMMLLPIDSKGLNFFLSLVVHMLLFFATTTGSVPEKGFLFLSYASIFTCTSIVFTIVESRLQNELMKSIFACIIMALMQILLYVVLLPSFRKVAPYLHTGWGKFYAVVLSFFALIVVHANPVMEPTSGKAIAVFLLILPAFCITYVSVFSSMKNMVELT